MLNEQKTVFVHTVTFWATKEEIEEDGLNIPGMGGYARELRTALGNTALFEIVSQSRAENGTEFAIVKLYTEKAETSASLVRWVQEVIFDAEGVIGAFHLGACLPYTVEYEVRTKEKVVVFAETIEDAERKVPRPRDFVGVTRSAPIPVTNIPST